MLAAQLTSQDELTLITFAQTARLVADRIPGNEAEGLVEVIAGVQPGGGTNLEQALHLGLSKAEEQQSASVESRVVLLTDGAANLGNAEPGDLSQLVWRVVWTYCRRRYRRRTPPFGGS